MKLKVTTKFYANLQHLCKNDFSLSLTKEQIDKMIFDTLINDEFIKDIKFENIIFEETSDYKFQGAICESEKKIFYFSQMLSSDNKLRSRNTFLSQGFYGVYKIASIKKYQIYTSLNPFSNIDVKSFTPNPLSIKLIIQIMKEIGVKFGNTIVLKENVFEDSLESFLGIKNNLRKRNTSNDGTYIEVYTKGIINIFATFQGAKWGETFLTCLLLAIKKEKWNIKKINFVHYDIEVKKAKSKEETLIDIGIENENINELVAYELSLDDKDRTTKEVEIQLKRMQDLFRKNILKFFNFMNECFACDYEIKENLIASHIHRFTDIKKDFEDNKISHLEAKKQATDGANGFLLCPNHDKEFEKGFIYFDIDNLMFKVNIDKVKNFLEENEIKSIENKISKKRLNYNKALTDKFNKYLEKHYERIKLNEK
ncbi:hypothetical protein GE118_01700 [Mycoplasma sp. NEAQ87857]|uniref:HNH endonuclease n=1 Tax=Mycoplasma sp. NEAQ87857 TaxID=2683967 RepID=UPI001316FF00|nr:HNH endonuclease [Mycoplasma sp. NEAQ87857]QGZ97510.1 hypothetical protein GE118_01700 [Mycoplasma sp. NEAQ87857]